MYIKGKEVITHEEMFCNKDDFIKREDVIFALLKAFSKPKGRELTETEFNALKYILAIKSKKQ